MKRTIYHGSVNIIEKPVYGVGKVYNDYGKGFYCTEELNMAKEWGVSKGRIGYANCYEIECQGLTILDLNNPDFCLLHWLSVLLENREFEASSPLAHQAKQYIIKTFHVEYQNYDCIIGYRADDSYFSFAQDFINGTISYRQLGNAMRLGKLGQQFVLKSRRSFDHIVFKGYEIAEPEEWFKKKNDRDRSARRQYFDTEKNMIKPGDIFVTQILSEEMKPDDPRLR